jgi:TonB-dependent receptor
MKNNRFTKTQIATSLSIALGAFSAPMVYAADEAADNVEVIEVKGIRGSVVKSMEVKRSSTGIVDSISSEDIGKFPDTNLAESLQRISGVSIDRNNGEGQKVTVRGFGSDRNLVLLNGRQLPNTNGDRSFNFDNVASEAISGAEVYKTSNATLPTGGIGATINLTTVKPLSIGEEKTSIGVKLVNDTSSDDGGITPELSGLYSNVYADGKLGVSISGSYASRESGSQQAEVGTGWRTFEAANIGTGEWGGIQADDVSNQTNIPTGDDVYSVPQTTIYKFEEQQRTRINSQLVLQYQIADNMRATFDAMYIEKEVDVQSNDISAWFTFAPTSNVWTDGPAASPLIYEETYSSMQDLAMGGSDYGTKEETQLFGFNLDWQVTDDLHVEFDHHSSKASNTPNNKYGSSNTVSLLSRIRSGASVDFSGDLPILTVEGASNLTVDSMEVGGSWFRNDQIHAEVDQTQINAKLELDDLGSIDFGVSLMTTSNHNQQAAQVQNDDWGGLGTDVFDSSYFKEESIHSQFDQVSGGHLNGDEILDTIYISNFADVRARAEELYGVESDTTCGTNYCASTNYAEGTDLYVEESMISLYTQYNYEGEIGIMPYDLHIGLRYEQTDVKSTSAVPDYEDYGSWVGDTEFYLTAKENADGSAVFVYQEREGDYSHLLPSINFNIELTDDIVARAAYSVTIGRPYFGDLAGGTTVGSQYNLGGASGASGNPSLLPLESTNIDLSLEWYYEEGSYLSVAIFDKKVTNAISTGLVTEQLFDVKDPSQGDIYAEAAAATDINDKTAMRQWIYDNYGPSDTVYLSETGAIVIEGVDGDGILDFEISVPTNSDDEQSYTGVELTAQHLFGESGFGVIGNYTVVDTGTTYDNLALEQVEDAETNISDSANLIAFYDANGFQARIAYNWRDEFLSATYQGTGGNPTYTEEYSQIDFNVSYDLPMVEGMNVFIEGINITDEYTRQHGRTSYQVLNVTQTGARYGIGARYSF